MKKKKSNKSNKVISKKKILKGGWFNNNKFVMVFSIVLAFIAWIIVTSSSQEEIAAIITNIPVKIELSEDAKEEGLMVFGGENLKAEVTISGSRLTVGSVTNNDIEVVAQANSITMPGNYPIQLTAKKIGSNTNFDISSNISPSFVTVMVDRNREIELDVKNLVQYSIDDNYYAPTPTISEPKIKVSGPESIISQIDHIAAVGMIGDNLTKTTSISSQLVFYDKYGEVITSDYISASAAEVTVTVQVFAKKHLYFTVDLENKPSGLEISEDWITIEPSGIEVAVNEDLFEGLAPVNLGSIDLSKVPLSGGEYVFDIVLPVGCRNLNTEYETATVKIDMSKMSKKTFSVETFRIDNIPQDKKAECTTNKILVTIIGLKEDIEKISESQIVAKIDISTLSENLGHTEVPVNIVINGNNTCWAYGDYTADIIISNISAESTQ